MDWRRSEAINDMAKGGHENLILFSVGLGRDFPSTEHPWSFKKKKVERHIHFKKSTGKSSELRQYQI